MFVPNYKTRYKCLDLFIILFSNTPLIITINLSWNKKTLNAVIYKR